MLIGVDLDNTIVCYDELFHREAVRLGLIPAETPRVKNAVRDLLRREGCEDQWTELQGRVYGTLMEDAPPFPGALAFFAACQKQGIQTCIISHRSRQPYRGEPVDLHQAARDWLQKRLPGVEIFLEETGQAKLQRIAQQACRWFIDDLLEFLLEENFPADVEPILFDPHDMHRELDRPRRGRTWTEITQLLLSAT